MQTISLHDDLEIRRIKTPEIQVKTNLYYLPTNENNLVYKAAKLLMDEFGIKEGVAIQLKKRIPVAAGMAGGSTDGAAVLWGMNQMYGLGLSRQELMERGVKLGADVPYCVQRGTALAEYSLFGQHGRFCSHERGLRRVLQPDRKSTRLNSSHRT